MRQHATFFTAIVFFFLLTQTAQSEPRPNILVLLADDLGWADLSCYGGRHSRTPNLDRLASEGARFTNFYAAAPNCSPSRAGLLTGRIPARTGLYNYIPPHGPLYLPEGEVTSAELLRQVGYQTVHVGKWHLCHDLLSDQLPQPRDHGFQYSMGTINNASPSHLNPTNFIRDGKPVGEVEGYSCQIVAGEVVRWLKEERNREHPFFINAWFHETHNPIASPPDLVSRHQGKPPRDALYDANVENLDLAIGRILAALSDLGLVDSTLVVFSSDNGGLNQRSNGPLRGRKSNVWEGGIREPGIMRWPGKIQPGSIIDQPAGLIDLLPTFCEAAGCEVPQDRAIDGVSLVPSFEGHQLQRSQPLFWFFYRVEPAAALRVGDWVLVGYLDGQVPPGHPLNAATMKWLKKAKLNRFELFNVRTDIRQEREASKANPDRFLSMRKQMIRLHQEVIAEGPVWNFAAPQGL